MEAHEIYYELCKFWRNNQKNGLSPKEMEEMGVRIEQIDDNSPMKFYGNDGGTVEVFFEVHDHCRTFELRPDTNHFSITLYDPSGKPIKNDHFMTVDEQ